MVPEPQFIPRKRDFLRSLTEEGLSDPPEDEEYSSRDEVRPDFAKYIEHRIDACTENARKEGL